MSLTIKKSPQSKTPLTLPSTLLALGLSTLILSGCSYLEPYKAPLTQGNVMTEESISSIQEGLTRDQVRALLGPPLGKNVFNPNHWEYIFYTSNNNPHTGSAKHLVINFDADGMIDTWKQSSEMPILKEDNSWLGLGWI